MLAPFTTLNSAKNKTKRLSEIIMSHEINQKLRASINPAYLEVTLMPTEQCNFRCTYCYEDFSIGKMSPKTIAAVKRFMMNRIASLNYLSLQWFGGEPLAAKGVVYEISEFAKSLCADHGVGFGGMLTTNGYLLDIKTAERLFELNQKGYQISLDGAGTIHDSTRKLASGAGTFDRIWTNLKAIRDSDLEVSILLRVHLTPENAQSVRELAVMLRTEFLHDRRFSVFLKPIENLGGPNRASISSLSDDERAPRLGELYRILYGDQPSSAASKKENLEICYASRPNSLVIRADGRVQKCTVLLSKDHNTVGHLTHDGRIQLDRGLMSKWMRGYETADLNVLRCPAQYFPSSKTDAKIIPAVLV
ncbi:radical SAM/SPASM domain protein maturase [compost metagenome]